MDATITVEFFSDTREHLKTLEQRLKHEHDVDVDLVEPRDATAPALVAIGIKKHGERAETSLSNRSSRSLWTQKRTNKIYPAKKAASISVSPTARVPSPA